MSSDARHVAKRLRTAGFTVEDHHDEHGRHRWVATHPDHPQASITWNGKPNIRAVMRRAGDLIGDPALAGRTARRSNAVAEAKRQQAADQARARQQRGREHAAALDVVDRRKLRGPGIGNHDLNVEHDVLSVVVERGYLDPRDIAQATGYTLTPHALDRIRQRAADAANIVRAIARPDRVVRFDNGHERHDTATCKVYLDPKARTVLTVV